MNWELFTAFLLASAALGMIPGPAVGAITATGLAHGNRAALLTVSGGMAAVMIQMLLIIAFTASFLSFLTQWMDVIRWVGVAYLAYLGIDAFRKAGAAANGEINPKKSAYGFIVRGFIANIANPKALAFLAAFFPQFIDPALPLTTQVVAMAVGYLAVLLVVDSTWALVGARAGRTLRSARARLWRDRASGGALLGAAAGLAAIRTG